MLTTDVIFHTTLESLSEILLSNNWRLCFAESCTGGWLAATVTGVAGSSTWFERGFVTYSNEAKQNSLGVKPATLAAFGAVSIQTAEEMSAGAKRAANCEVAVSVTGVAGPDGGTAEKPVGTVCFGFALPDGRVVTRKRWFAGARNDVRLASVEFALSEITRLLVNERL